MKDSYRDAYGTALLYAYRKDLEDGKKTVKQLMNDYSPAAMDTVENIYDMVYGGLVYAQARSHILHKQVPVLCMILL